MLIYHHTANWEKENLPNMLRSTYQMTEGRHVSAGSPSQFDCGTGIYVDPKQVCDFTLDCPHGEDEANCREYSLILYNMS